eukprot:TRINITY_DN44613_c1_g1_i1.p3 TRINITY_DN44613_c1_g1~~TRINITY_DN44613_c1_g1_i1.p3  ORF type:complete len:200 (-),score=27.45 TRINITY_DN44613_c1_g1_i1:1862-2461(-)
MGLSSASCWGIWDWPVWGVDGNLSMMEFEESCEPCLAPPVSEWGPVQLGKHVFHAGCLAVPVDHPAGSTTLHLLHSADVLGSVWVPYRCGILKYGPNKGFVCLLLDRDGAHLQVAPEKAKGLVGFVRDVGDVGVPAQILGDGDTQVVGLSCCFQGMAMEFILSSQWVFLSCDVESLALIRVERHRPTLFPAGQVIEVLL